MPPSTDSDTGYPLHRHAEGGLAYFYKDPNPALAEILVGTRLHALTGEYTTKVAVNYVTSLEARPKQTSDRHPGAMSNAVSAEVFIGGYKTDRWIGQITVGVQYALADEMGRKNPTEGQHGSVYQGSGALRSALYAELPPL
ncbi:Uncharacterised protein [Mycobacteroides abscessus subsp. abscessus]|uniref:Porin n=1 Tax=Mycobacteroides abscessus subsp. abscessus TaxID=1185650 RepID=A0AB38D1B1_9MYCO|nr:hypothetical protein [Mycobacteroides abscessus]SHX07190.1 Uncharacterised protein [Mycobacteroides abscessus subsp. abscessus]SIA10606.1 Uncharacterised protein [Mycobacteroides abscessus subsp. abscessus]SIB13182.1 Uncharacterised protein [Mycobacteroides abscessus subsp. abscessus]SIB15422.1 Uncharacterised protein [Mycobacteroides abscessus subsp. abscessus]SIB16826.1 Uncharacterised protein [Mycobacteroides abscessus subsp. abscessus]